MDALSTKGLTCSEYPAGAIAHIRAIVAGYPRRLWGEKLLVMLQIYIDDSASDSGAQRLFLCGYVNTAESWIRFTEEWETALKAAPAIRELHMVDAWALKGEFANFTLSERDAKLEALADVIQKYRPTAIRASLDRATYRKVMKPSGPAFLQNSFVACFFGIIILTAKFHKQMGFNVPVDFVFDESSAGPEAVIFFQYIKNKFPEYAPILGSTPVFRDDKDVLPLQAADMMAWSTRRRHDFPNEFRYYETKIFHIVAEQHMDDEFLHKMGDLLAEIPLNKLQHRREWSKIRDDFIEKLNKG